MSAPVFQTVSAQASGTGSSIATNAPSGVAAGDLLDLRIACLASRTITTPTGWTPVIEKVDPSSNTREACFNRIADGTSDDTPTVSLSGSSQYRAWILRISGADTTTPVDVSNSGGDATGATTLHSVPAVTTTGDDRLLVTSINVFLDGGFTTNPPTGFTDVATAGAGALLTHAISRRTATTAGSYGGGTIRWVNTGTNSASMLTVAYKPAPPASSRRPKSYNRRRIPHRHQAARPRLRASRVHKPAALSAEPYYRR